MIDLILILFAVGCFCLGFKAGAKYKTSKDFFAAAKSYISTKLNQIF